MLNIAIIGLGWWGRTHINAIHNKSDKVKVIRVVDLNIEELKRLCIRTRTKINCKLSRRT